MARFIAELGSNHNRDADRAFAQGKSAFDIGGTFTLAAIQQEGMKASDLIAFGLPPADRLPPADPGVDTMTTGVPAQAPAARAAQCLASGPAALRSTRLPLST